MTCLVDINTITFVKSKVKQISDLITIQMATSRFLPEPIAPRLVFSFYLRDFRLPKDFGIV